MLRLIIFNVLLFGSCGYALARGTRDAKVVGITTLIASFASLVRLHSYGSVELTVLIIDLAVLGAFIVVAISSDRFWPLWISGLQLISTVGHAMKFANPDLAPIAYAVALRFWAYPIQIILLIAVWRSVRRRNSTLSSEPSQS